MQVNEIRWCSFCSVSAILGERERLVTAPALAKHGVEGVLTPSTQGTEAAPAGASLPRVAESLLEGGFKAVSGATPLEVAARMVQ
eukprot:3293696-Pleurochrysis_carterae.AAC.1